VWFYTVMIRTVFLVGVSHDYIRNPML